MIDVKPSFYLHARGEHEELSQPRPCWEKARLRDDVRDDYMLVKIDPPLVGQQFGLGAKDVDMVVLASRLEGQTLFPVTEWPCPVYVARLVDESVVATGVFSPSQVELITWGIIFKGLDEAMADAQRIVF